MDIFGFLHVFWFFFLLCTHFFIVYNPVYPYPHIVEKPWHPQAFHINFTHFFEVIHIIFLFSLKNNSSYCKIQLDWANMQFYLIYTIGDKL